MGRIARSVEGDSPSSVSMYRVYCNLFPMWLNFQFLDKRTQGWPFVASVYPVLAVVVLYLFVVWYGQKFMARRKALNLRYVMIAYNVGLVALSAYMCVEVSEIIQDLESVCFLMLLNFNTHLKSNFI